MSDRIVLDLSVSDAAALRRLICKGRDGKPISDHDYLRSFHIVEKITDAAALNTNDKSQREETT